MDEYITNVIKMSSKSLKSKDVPVGAIIVKNNKIIARGINTREKKQDILGHAEINAIKNATKKLNNWNLSGCDMYVTLRPCSMCMEVIKQSRISNVYYLLDKSETKKEYSNVNIIKLDNKTKSDEYSVILSNFFKELREKD